MNLYGHNGRRSDGPRPHALRSGPGLVSWRLLPGSPAKVFCQVARAAYTEPGAATAVNMLPEHRRLRINIWTRQTPNSFCERGGMKALHFPGLWNCGQSLNYTRLLFFRRSHFDLKLWWGWSMEYQRKYQLVVFMNKSALLFFRQNWYIEPDYIYQTISLLSSLNLLVR